MASENLEAELMCVQGQRKAFELVVDVIQVHRFKWLFVFIHSSTEKVKPKLHRSGSHL